VEHPLEISQGGIRFYDKSQLDGIKKMLLKFQQKSDTKAAVVICMAYTLGQVCQCPVMMVKSRLVRTDDMTVSYFHHLFL